MSWADLLLEKVRAVHAEIAALQRYLAEPQETPLTAAQVEAAFAGHYAMLDDLYLNQIPFARAAAGADLFLNYRGPTDATQRAGLGAVDRLFGNVRTQVSTMTRAVIDAREEAEPPARGRGEVELTVCSYAPGLYAGFSLPAPPEAGADADPRHGAMRQSLHNLGVVAHCLPEAGAHDLIAARIDDPEVRDATLGAIKKLLPYRDKTVDAIELRGRALGDAPPAAIDRRAWQVADALMAEPMADAERAVFTGHILQIDYELNRFELRWLDDPRLGHIRCAYPAELAAQCEALAKRKVEVRGAVDFRRGRPRLLRVEAISGIS